MYSGFCINVSLVIIDCLRAAANLGESSPGHEAAALREWKDGVDCVKVEPSILCHDGESIQASTQQSIHINRDIEKYYFLSHFYF